MQDDHWGWGKLQTKVEDTPGLHGHSGKLKEIGIFTWHHFGSLTEKQWLEKSECILQKRVGYPEDLRNPQRLGPGHLNSLDELQKEATKQLKRCKAIHNARTPSQL